MSERKIRLIASLYGYKDISKMSRGSDEYIIWPKRGRYPIELSRCLSSAGYNLQSFHQTGRKSPILGVKDLGSKVDSTEFIIRWLEEA